MILTFLLRFGSTLYRQIVGIPTGTNCALLAADLFLLLFCYERDFMCVFFLTGNSQTDVIEASNSTNLILIILISNKW